MKFTSGFSVTTILNQPRTYTACKAKLQSRSNAAKGAKSQEGEHENDVDEWTILLKACRFTK